MIKIIVAILLVTHGLVHLLLFVVPWNLMEVDGLPYSTTILTIIAVLLIGREFGFTFLPFS